MPQILLFGAGKSATVLIDYLKKAAVAKNWNVVVADADLLMAEQKVGNHPLVLAVELAVEEEIPRKKLINESDVVISMLPASLHYLVAVDCVNLGKHLLTASYIDAAISQMSDEISKKNLLFLCEMGLDPGIDHMSAMQLIHSIQNKGGNIQSFQSHCGGLVAPESDNNPWHYKLSWNPRNVILAGKAGAVYVEDCEIKNKDYEELFVNCPEVSIEGVGQLAFYPNRDSLSYQSLYGLEDTTTFIRTTLRYPGFCKGWEWIVKAGLTEEQNSIDTSHLTIATFLHNHFAKHELNFASLPELVQSQLQFIGWNENTLLNKGLLSSAAILQSILEKKWQLQPTDKDMVVMFHEIDYTLDNTTHFLKSSLVVKGQDQLHTAMAKTVGLPLGIAATLLLEGKLTARGLLIPTIPSIYEPVLHALTTEGILFKESES